MTYSLLSVIRICADEIAGDDEGRQAWRRKAYVWRKLGKVLPDGPPYARGAGAAKRYEAAAIPLIGVMLCIAKRFSSVELLDEISQKLQRRLSANRAFSRCWAEALALGEGRKSFSPEQIDLARGDGIERVIEATVSRSIWLTIAFEGPLADLSVRCGAGPVIRSGEDADIYSLDLGLIFSELASVGTLVFGESFRLASPSRRGRR